MSTQDNSDAVLIVGAGPAGLTLALTLLKNGIPVHIINKAPTNHREQRGLGIQPRTQEVFHFLGTVQEILSRANGAQTVRFYRMPGSVVMSTSSFTAFEDNTPQKPYNNPQLVAQYHTEGVLRSHLQKYGCSVEMATELVSLKQYNDYVEAVLKKSLDGQETTETKRYRWLIGADGGKSTVRKQCGLSFEGSSTHETWILAEMYIAGLEPGVLHWYNWLGEDSRVEKSMLLREIESEPGRYLVSTAGNIDADRIIANHEYLKDTVRALTERDDLRFGEIAYLTDYRPSVRMVNKFDVGRIFVAGDAAHVHTPRGGQGLNSGVQDAFNLGWKLALVEKGLAPRALLDTYNEERLPVIQCMLQETVKVYQRFADNMKNPKAGMEHPAYLKQLGINYRWSSIVLDERVAHKPAGDELDPYGVNSDDAPRAGDRAPNATGLVRVDGSDLVASHATSLFDIFVPTHHTALVFGEDAACIASIVKGLSACPPGTVTSIAILPQRSGASAVEGVNITLRDRDGIAYDGYRMEKEKTLVVIVRPDGVVGAVVSGEEGVKTYFGGILSEMAAA